MLVLWFVLSSGMTQPSGNRTRAARHGEGKKSDEKKGKRKNMEGLMKKSMNNLGIN